MTQNDSIYSLREIKPRLSPLLAFVLVIDITMWMSANYIVGTIFSILVLGVLFISNGYVIDKENKKIKNETKFLGLTFGKWRDLPEINYISLLRVKQSRKTYQASSAMFVQTSSKNYTYQLNLIINDPRKRILRLISGKKEKIINVGLKLGEFLDLKVFDVTTLDKKWIR